MLGRQIPSKLLIVNECWWWCNLIESVRTSSKLGSIFGVLANLFGNVEDITSQYRDLLAEKLLVKDVPLSGLVAELELFKAKFPSSTWTSCDVMLRDVEISTKTLTLAGETKLFVLSHLYWPLTADLGDGCPVDHLLCCEQVEILSNRYHNSHQSRNLKFRPDLSRVIVKVEFSNGLQQFDCSDIAAQIVLSVSDKSQSMNLILESFSAKFSAEQICNATQFWVRKRVLLLEEGLIKLAEDYDPSLPGKRHKNLRADLTRRIL